MGVERWTLEEKIEDMTAIFEYLQSVLFGKENGFLLEFQRITLTKRWKLQGCRFLLNTRNAILPLEMFSPKHWAAF